MLALYEVMYLPGQVHIFTAFADTDCEVIKVERHVRTRQYRSRPCTVSSPIPMQYTLPMAMLC